VVGVFRNIERSGDLSPTPENKFSLSEGVVAGTPPPRPKYATDCISCDESHSAKTDATFHLFLIATILCDFVPLGLWSTVTGVCCSLPFVLNGFQCNDCRLSNPFATDRYCSKKYLTCQLPNGRPGYCSGPHSCNFCLAMQSIRGLM
jgi:hypothetical protein